MTSRAHKKKQDYILERVMRRLERIEKTVDMVDESENDAAQAVYEMENELEKAEADVMETLSLRVAKLEKEAHKMDVSEIVEAALVKAEDRVTQRMSQRMSQMDLSSLNRANTPGPGGHFEAQGGEDLHGRALPNFNELVGDSRTMHTLEAGQDTFFQRGCTPRVPSPPGSRGASVEAVHTSPRARGADRSKRRGDALARLLFVARGFE